MISYVYQGGKQVWERLGVRIGGTSVGNALLESTRGVDPYFDASVGPVTLNAGQTVTLDLSAGTGSTGVLRVSQVRVYDA